jgi:hypothetical protein
MSYILKSMENRVKIAPEQRLFGAFCGSHRRRFRSFSEEKGAKAINNGVWKTSISYSAIPSVPFPEGHRIKEISS